VPKKPSNSKKIPMLRKKAEALLRATKDDVAALPSDEARHLVHELQVHQIELEMQNEELRRGQIDLEAARDRYTDLYDFSPVGHLTLDMQHRVVEANLTAGTLLRVNRKSLIGLPLDRLIARDHHDTFHRHCQEVLKAGTRQTCEVQLREEAGVKRWVYFESLAAHNETGRTTHWRTAFLDVSDRKRAEGEERRSEAFISSILENLPAMIFVKDAKELRFVRLNKSGEDLLGYSRGELMGKNDYDFFPQDEADFFSATDREVLASGRLLDIPQEPIRIRSGETRYLHTQKIPIVGMEGTPQYLLGISEDITDRKRAEEALRLAKFSIDRAADAIYWIDPQAKILDVNEAASRMLGYSKDELCAMTVHDLNPDFQVDRWPGFWAETRRHGTMVIETVHRTKNGRLIPIEVSVNYLFYEGKEYHCAFVRDITKRKRAEEHIVQLATRLDLATSAAHIGVWDWNIQENKLAWDDRMFALYGVEKEDFSCTYDAWLSGVHPADRARCDEAIQQALRKEKPYNIEFRVCLPNGMVRVIKADGQVIWGMDGTPLRMTGVNYDITEQRLADEALQLSEIFTRAILDSLSAHICVLSKEGTILKTNDAWKEFAQQHVGDVITLGKAGDNFFDRFRHIIAGNASTSQTILKGVEAVLRGDQPSFSAEYQTLLPNGPAWFQIRVTPLKESQGVVISRTDVSERVRIALLLKQHIVLLRKKREELESLTGKLIDAQEEERKRIARDLHDDFNQRLAALAVELEGLERIPNAWPEPVARQLAMIRGQVAGLSDNLHDLAYQLHPSLLYHVGLEIAVRDHVAEFTKRTGLPVRFTVRDVPGALSPEIATNLFRVMQESLQNVAKHARATEVSVRLSGSPKGIGLSVRDNGKGFDLEDKGERVKGLGLVSMQERARSLGGFFNIHSSEHGGTNVCAFIPRSQEGL
jgi:PAS domain S-box-containing protein